MNPESKNTPKTSLDKRLIIRMVALFTVLLLPFGLYATMEGDQPVLSAILFCLIVLSMFLGAWG